MNERIQQLSEQAEEYAAQNATGDWEVGPAYQDLFNKKFAELIVQECATIADKDSSQPCASYGELIKQHFGVEL